MVDVYVVTILVALVHLGCCWRPSKPQLGAFFFGAVVVLTMSRRAELRPAADLGPAGQQVSTEHERGSASGSEWQWDRKDRGNRRASRSAGRRPELAPGPLVVWLIPADRRRQSVSILAYSRLLRAVGPRSRSTFEHARMDSRPARPRVSSTRKSTSVVVEAVELSQKISPMVRDHGRASSNGVRAPYLTENTRFWVVRAEVTAGQVSGLGTDFCVAPISRSIRLTEGTRATPLRRTREGTRRDLRTSPAPSSV